MLGLTLSDHITNVEIRTRTGLTDAVERITTRKVELGGAHCKNAGEEMNQTDHRVED